MNSSSLRLETDNNFVWYLFLAFCTITSILMTSDIAFAAADPDDVIGSTLCRLVKNLSGGIARGIATLAIFSVGVGMFLGKLNWGVAGATAAGVGVIFSAPRLVAFLSGDSNGKECPIIS